MGIMPSKILQIEVAMFMATRGTTVLKFFRQYSRVFSR